MSDDEYDPLEDPTMFRAPVFTHDTAGDILGALMDSGLIHEYQVMRPKVDSSNYILSELTAGIGVRSDERDRVSRPGKWFSVHVESLPAKSFEGLMEGSTYSELLTRALDKMKDPKVFAILGDGRHWVMWLVRDGSRKLNPELSLGPYTLPPVLTSCLREGQLIWVREPRYVSASAMIPSLQRVSGLKLHSEPKNSYSNHLVTEAKFEWPKPLALALESSLGVRTSVSLKIEILIEQSYRNDVALRLWNQSRSTRHTAFVDDDGWALRVSTSDESYTSLDVNVAELVASQIASVLGGTVWTPF